MKLVTGRQIIGGWPCLVKVIAEREGRTRRAFIYPDARTENNEQIILEYLILPWDKSPLFDTWLKKGYIEKTDSLIFQNTYLVDEYGDQKRGFNPQSRRRGKEGRINFKYILDDEQKNLERLVNDTMVNLTWK